jgi:glucokinase
MEKYIAGIDIGGTNLRCGAVDKDGSIFGSVSLRLNENFYETGKTERQTDFVIKNIKQFLEANKKYEIQKIGVGIAGQIDYKSGNVLFSPNLNWHNVPLKNKLEEETGLDVYVVNDLTAITYGEWKFGSGKGEDNIVCIFVGTGIGSGIIINGSLYSGCSNAAGEIGHITVVSGGRKCACGNSGCLEAYAGGRGIAEIAKEKASNDISGFKNIIDIAGGKISAITAETIVMAYKAGDSEAAALIEKTGLYLSDGVISAVNFLNPCAIILGGSIIEGIPDLLNIIKENVEKKAVKASASGLKILKSSLGNNAGIIGAAGLVRDSDMELKPANP